MLLTLLIVLVRTTAEESVYTFRLVRQDAVCGIWLHNPQPHFHEKLIRRLTNSLSNYALIIDCYRLPICRMTLLVLLTLLLVKFSMDCRTHVIAVHFDVLTWRQLQESSFVRALLILLSKNRPHISNTNMHCSQVYSELTHKDVFPGCHVRFPICITGYAEDGGTIKASVI
ncbi:hypothetical protein CSKR_110813 [Clonorchis sinensis]|uniref:Uncharacterized protein n=1 Tax=Clonorchis sinensis TaxID=79923 RepID=A0A3R7EPI4_CLOSI|nr:hypothetical protein CSKR_110813 [Clonorchis sinensis]